MLIAIDKIFKKIRTCMNLPYLDSRPIDRRIRPYTLRQVLAPPCKASLLAYARAFVDFQRLEKMLNHLQSAVEFSRRHNGASLSGTVRSAAWSVEPSRQ